MMETAIKMESSLSKTTKKVVFLMLSGGKDSGVAARLLKDAGHEVIGFFIKGWAPAGLKCLEPPEMRDAAEIARAVGIEFFPILNWSEHFYNAVFDPMLSGYLSGITPNPDTLCNREIKFGLFAKFAFGRGADFIASGHYVRKNNNPLRLLTARDYKKDQSYFLYDLKPEVLERSLFPIGNYVKSEEVIPMAKSFGLPHRVIEKRPTRDICFLLKSAEDDTDGGRIGMEELLRLEGERRGVKFSPGPVINEKTGKVVGEHNGVSLYAVTIGQRHGLGVAGGEPLYVSSKDVSANTLYVNSKQPNSFEIIVRNLNWISGEPDFTRKLSAKIRTPQKAQSCFVEKTGEDEIRVKFDTPQNSVAPGQACVLYDGEVVLGGGIITS